MVAALALAATGRAQAGDLDEFKVKRQTVYEFSAKPTLRAAGDHVEIAFAVRASCDATVVIERPAGKIIRHLASGVLGPNAPAPFQKDSLSQKLVWDGKDDQGAYVENKTGCRVRVSLGLRASYERSLFWEPKKRIGQDAPCMVAAPEGVYVYDGRVFDHVRLFDHDGNYVRTIYPFPAGKLEQVQGLHWRQFPQDNARLPLKEGFHQSTLLSSGNNAGFDEKIELGVDQWNNWHGSVWGNAACMLAVRDKRIALGRLRLNRLAADGTSGGLPLAGGDITFPITPRGNVDRGRSVPVAPRSAAFSPDGKWLYLTGYVFGHGQTASRDIVLITQYDWLPVVARVNFAEGGNAEPFIGGPKLTDAGDADNRFKMPTSLAVDSAGRIYVTDYFNDRLQVFDAGGKLLKSIAIEAPAQVAIHPKTQEIYVFSWQLAHAFGEAARSNPRLKIPRRRDKESMPAELTVLKSFDDPKPVVTCPLPLGPAPARGAGYPFRAALDGHTDPPTIWLVSDWGRLDIMTQDKIKHTNVKLYTLSAGQLEPKGDFNADAAQSVVRTEAPEYGRQRLYVSPATGLLYVGEGSSATGKSFRDVVQIDPASGKVKNIQLPFDAEDLCFDINGLAYLRTFYLVARYDPRNWREVPWDYGEEHGKVSTSSSSDRRVAAVQSAIRLPVKSAGLHHHGGMNISPRGHLVVAVNNYGTEVRTRKDIYDEPVEMGGTPYVPPVFPGRVRWGEIHIWDKHGNMLHEDAVPGMNRTDGVAIDRDDNVYVMSTATRVLDGKLYFNDMTGTLLKIAPRKSKLLSPSDKATVRLPDADRPKRPAEIFNGHVGRAWLEGAMWFYGGVGFCGKNAARSGGGCDCYNARFALDYLARSFAPEIDHCSVAVLDSNGNLILRIGRYGNADSSGPNSPAPLGGDEVGLFYAPYVATDTDKRVFIADPGNARIVSVRLDYHASELATMAPAANP